MQGFFKQDDLEKVEKLMNQYNHNLELLEYEEVVSDKKLTAKILRDNSKIADICEEYKRFQDLENQIQICENEKISATEEEKIILNKEIEDIQQKQKQTSKNILLLLSRIDCLPEEAVVEILTKSANKEIVDFVLKGLIAFCGKNCWEYSLQTKNDSVCLFVSGVGAFSILKEKYGIFRFVLLETISDCPVYVYEKPKCKEISFGGNDIRIDTFHSNGAGGQNVNKVETAIRVTHLETGIVAICQDERSQIQNRNKAIERLKEKVLDFANTKTESEIKKSKEKQKREITQGYVVYVFDREKKIVKNKLNNTEISFEEFLKGEFL